MSASIASARPPSDEIRSARSSRRSFRLAPSETAAPAPASAIAVASPIPEEAPVIAATLPSSSPAIGRTIGASLWPGRPLRGGFGGERLGLPHGRALERVRQRAHVRARRGLEDVGGDALAAGQSAARAQHHGYLSERVLALGHGSERVLAQLALDAGGLLDRDEDRVHGAVARRLGLGFFAGRERHRDARVGRPP